MRDEGRLTDPATPPRIESFALKLLFLRFPRAPAYGPAIWAVTSWCPLRAPPLVGKLYTPHQVVT